jgi:hypothetical protein
MNRLLLKLAITAAVGSLLSSNPTVAQLVPDAKRAARVEITKGPALELADDHSAIIRWTTNNPGGCAGALRRGALRYGSRRPEPDSEKSHQAKPDTSRDDFSRARARPEAADDLLL